MRCVVRPAHVVRRPLRTTIATVAEIDARPSHEQEIRAAIAAAQHHPELAPLLEEAADA
jgi:hypothetical protein